jgi:hypothetical protein
MGETVFSEERSNTSPLDAYTLIGLDQTEQSVVRRLLQQGGEHAIRTLISAIQQKNGLVSFPMTAPRWETNVYPLYYWAYQKVGRKKVYTYLVELLPTLFSTANVAVPTEELECIKKSGSRSQRSCFLYLKIWIPTAEGGS